MKTQLLLFASFGGPRNLDEIAPFLKELLTDPDVIRTPFPYFAQKWFFTRIAKKRAEKIKADYTRIGGRSPIYADTEELAKQVGEKLKIKSLAFHRYLPATHDAFLEEMRAFKDAEIIVFPLFPQFSYATTGSIARFFLKKLPQIADKMRWVASFPTHPAYVSAMQRKLREFLEEREIKEEKSILLFSAHGLPKKFIEEGDLYEKECVSSYHAIAQGFPKAEKILAYQSKFGRGEWLTPATEEICRTLPKTDKQVVVIPLAFLSDHIETLFEIEEQYLPLLRTRGISAHRCPALNLRPDWIAAIGTILQDTPSCTTRSLVR